MAAGGASAIMFASKRSVAILFEAERKPASAARMSLRMSMVRSQSSMKRDMSLVDSIVAATVASEGCRGAIR